MKKDLRIKTGRQIICIYRTLHDLAYFVKTQNTGTGILETITAFSIECCNRMLKVTLAPPEVSKKIIYADY